MEFEPYIVIVDSDNPVIPDLNLQIDDIGKEYELECIVKMERLDQTLTNNTYPHHTYRLVIQSVSKFQEEV